MTVSPTASGSTDLCPVGHVCDAMCGYCQNPSTAVINVDDPPIEVSFRSTDYSNSPTYYDVSFEKDTTYRFRGSCQEHCNVVSLTLVDVTGYPIRRSSSNSGKTMNMNLTNEPLNLTGLHSLQRDNLYGCSGDIGAEIIYKATETAVYKM